MVWVAPESAIGNLEGGVTTANWLALTKLFVTGTPTRQACPTIPPMVQGAVAAFISGVNIGIFFMVLHADPG